MNTSAGDEPTSAQLGIRVSTSHQEALAAENESRAFQPVSNKAAYSKQLFAFCRGGQLEVVVHGASLFQVGNGLFSNLDSPSVEQQSVIARSLVNPWFFQVADPSLLQDFMALALGSHAGQPLHLEKLKEFIAYAGLSEDDLYAPRTRPFDPHHWGEFQGAMSPSRLNHPASGKHLLILMACKQWDWPLENYCAPQHPFVKKLFGILGKEAGEKLTWLSDSCGLPTPSMTMGAILSLWNRLANSQDPKIRAMLNLWNANPRLVGGAGRLDTELLEISAGKCVVKEAEDGLLLVQTLPHADSRTQSCLIKLAAGHNSRHLFLALWSLLSHQPDLNLPMAELRDYLQSRLEVWIPRDQELLTCWD